MSVGKNKRWRRDARWDEGCGSFEVRTPGGVYRRGRVRPVRNGVRHIEGQLLFEVRERA